ncbi:polyphosphate kinase 2 [Reichenbachiella sp.]|uniref:polyphosphate kinase 2 n=1 Tax=Reichenbachiella sp. TaxID=2184521 RepID=UPI003297DABF
MKKQALKKEEVALINSKWGLEALFSSKTVNLDKVLEKAKYEAELKKVQTELIKLQTWVIKNNKKIVVLFEGRDAAGKGGAIRRITEHMNPRHFRIVALNIPTKDERDQWFMQRYINQLPKPGEMVFFDRSWYNRAVVEPVNGFCTESEYKTFMSQVNEFEKMLIQSNTYLIKFYFSITKKEQAKRFADIKKSPLKQWKMTPVDEKSQELWDDYTFYEDTMFKKTNTKQAPWIIIDANKKARARVEAIEYILKTIPFKYSL